MTGARPLPYLAALRMISQRVRRRRAAAVLIATVVGAVLGVSLHRTPRFVGVAPASDGARLIRSLKLIETFSPRGDNYLSPAGLIADLATTDPSTKYQVLVTPDAVPANGAIGIFVSADSLWLRIKRGDRITELRRVGVGPDIGTYGPFAISPTTVPDGEFGSPLLGVWTVQTSRFASVHWDTSVHEGSPGSLRIDGTGRTGRVATAVTQGLASAAPAPADTVYRVALVAKAHDLSRPIVFELKLLYTDGTYEIFSATSSNGTPNLPAGTSKGWLPLQIQAVAHMPVKGVVLFAADTGLIPLRGSAWVDDFTLGRT